MSQCSSKVDSAVETLLTLRTLFGCSWRWSWHSSAYCWCRTRWSLSPKKWYPNCRQQGSSVSWSQVSLTANRLVLGSFCLASLFLFYSSYLHVQSTIWQTKECLDRVQGKVSGRCWEQYLLYSWRPTCKAPTALQRSLYLGRPSMLLSRITLRYFTSLT